MDTSVASDYSSYSDSTANDQIVTNTWFQEQTRIRKRVLIFLERIKGKARLEETLRRHIEGKKSRGKHQKCSTKHMEKQRVGEKVKRKIDNTYKDKKL